MSEFWVETVNQPVDHLNEHYGGKISSNHRERDRSRSLSYSTINFDSMQYRQSTLTASDSRDRKYVKWCDSLNHRSNAHGKINYSNRVILDYFFSVTRIEVISAREHSNSVPIGLGAWSLKRRWKAGTTLDRRLEPRLQYQHCGQLGEWGKQVAQAMYCQR